jgi:hypothetical protein
VSAKVNKYVTERQLASHNGRNGFAMTGGFFNLKPFQLLEAFAKTNASCILKASRPCHVM